MCVLERSAPEVRYLGCPSRAVFASSLLFSEEKRSKESVLTGQVLTGQAFNGPVDTTSTVIL